MRVQSHYCVSLNGFCCNNATWDDPLDRYGFADEVSFHIELRSLDGAGNMTEETVRRVTKTIGSVGDGGYVFCSGRNIPLLPMPGECSKSVFYTRATHLDCRNNGQNFVSPSKTEKSIAHRVTVMKRNQIMNTQTSTLANGVNVDLMSHETKLQHMTVEELAQKCAQETDLFFTHHDYDSSYGFELFRRAVQNKDERALEAVITQYQPLVARWVDRWMNKHSDSPLINEEAQDFIAQAFERFWASFTPAKFDKSQNLAAILRYLQMCVHGAVTDAWRKFRRIRLEQELRDEEKEFSQPETTPEDVLQNHEFWQLIKKKSKDPKEYTVVYASFGLALSPREILAEYPGLFRDIKEIYQYKANLLDRLERDDEIRDFARGR